MRARALIGRDVLDAAHLGERADVAHRGWHDLDGRPICEERADLDARLDLAQRLANVDRDERKQPKSEQRECDRRDAQRAQQRRAAEADHRLAKGEPHASPSTLLSGLNRLGRVEDELAAIHLDRAIVRAPYQIEIVRRHHHRGSGRVDLAKKLKHAAGRALVEISRRLVGDEHEWIVHERAGNRHALLLAATQLTRKARGLRRQARPAPAREPPWLNRRARRTDHLERERDVRLRGSVLEQAEVLKHDAELATQLRHIASLDAFCA